MATLLKADGTTREVQPANGKTFTLAEIYELTNCTYVQAIRAPDGRLMLMDEDANAKRPPPPMNLRATLLLGGIIADCDKVIGDVILVDATEFN